MDKDVPYIAFEAEMARHERSLKRLVLALIICILLLFASNMGWLWFFNQFDMTTQTVTVESEESGNASYIGQDGTINNGGDN